MVKSLPKRVSVGKLVGVRLVCGGAIADAPVCARMAATGLKLNEAANAIVVKRLIVKNRLAFFSLYFLLDLGATRKL